MWVVELWDGQGWAEVAACYTFGVAFALVQEYRAEGHGARLWRDRDRPVG
jgi:hypothetical protein